MIILDTNVLSALMRTRPDAEVAAWLDQQPAESVWITAVTVFEARFGIALLAPGRRRQEIEKAFTKMLSEDLEGTGIGLRSGLCRAGGYACCCASTVRTSGRLPRHPDRGHSPRPTRHPRYPQYQAFRGPIGACDKPMGGSMIKRLLH